MPMSIIDRIATKLKALHKKHGWRAFGIIILYYLVRDLTLYVLIPFLAISAMK